MQTTRRPRHQYVLFALLAAAAVLLVPGTDVSWSAPLMASAIKGRPTLNALAPGGRARAVDGERPGGPPIEPNGPIR